MINPYQSWHSVTRFTVQDLQKDLRNIVEIATLAANSHNTQPWKFNIVKNSIEVIPDFNRPLNYSDRTNRQMYISLGCAVGNIIVAAAKCGLETKTDFLPEDNWENCAVKIIFSGKKSGKPLSELYPSIVKRVTNRFPFEPQPIDQKLLDEMENLGQGFGVKVDFITNSELKIKICDLIFEIGKQVYDDKIFKKELSTWTRGTDTLKTDGMPLFDLDMPALLSRMGPKLLMYLPATMLAGREKKLMQSAPAFLTISHSLDNQESWLRTGIAFQLISLRATLEDLSFCPWAGFVEHPIGNEKISKLLGSSDRLLFFARLGKPTKPMPHSPRRPIAEVLAKC